MTFQIFYSLQGFFLGTWQETRLDGSLVDLLQHIGEDLDVLLELSDRILVLCGGKVSGIVDGRTADKNNVGLLMTKLGGGEVG